MVESFRSGLTGRVVISTRRTSALQNGVCLALCVGILAGLAAENAWASETTTTALILTAGGSVVSTVPVKTTVTLAAAVSTAGTPVTTGQVQFCDAAAPHCLSPHVVGLAQLTSNGTATYTFLPGPGPHSYSAVFLGTSAFSSSVSAAVPLTVAAGSAGTTITSTALSYGGSQGDYTLTATVPAGISASPTGTISFQDTNNSNYVLATAPLSITGSNGISFLNSYNYLTAADPTSGSSESFIAEADFNGDGTPDLAVTTQFSQRLSILLGQGDGTFTSSVVDLGQYSPSAIVAADFNSDGKIDLAVTSNSGDGIKIFLGNGDGTFTPPQTIPISSYLLLAAGDLNGDGIMDLVSVTVSGNNATTLWSVTALFGNGDGTFRISPSSYEVSDAPFGLTLGDFNGDGKLDIAVASSSNTADTGVVSILLGNGDGTFEAAKTVSTGAAFLGLAAGDLNGDGKLDLVIANESFTPVTVLLGNGDGTFTQLPGDPTEVFLAYTIGLADFNGDGILDVAVSDADTGNVYVLLGKGDGTFTIDNSSPTTPAFIGISIATADFNGDGQTDMAVSFYDDNLPDVNDDQVKVWLAQDAGTSIATVTGISPVGTGIHYVDAVYAGDSDYTGSTSNTVPLLAQQVPTTVALTAPGNSITGQPVTLTATLQPSTAQNHLASGTVTFTQGATKLGTASLSAGVATLSVTSLPVGSDYIACKYSGDTNFLASVCNHLQVTISLPIPTTTTIAVTPNPSTYGQPVVFTTHVAPVTPNKLIPTGTVLFTFCRGASTNVALDANGNGFFIVPTGTEIAEPVSSCSFTGQYSGDTTFNPSTSASAAFVVNPAPSTTTIVSASPNPASVSQPVVFTIKVTGMPSPTADPITGNPLPPGALQFSGTVQLFDGTTSIASGPVAISGASTGQAVITVATLAVGSHTITATYTNDPNLASSISPSVTEVINPAPPADFTFTGPSTITFRTEATGNGTLTLASLNGFAASIALACNPPLPTHYLCTLAPPTPILPANSTASSTITLQPDLTSAATRHSTRIIFAILSPLALLGFARRRRSRFTPLLTLTLLAILTTTLTACGPDIFYAATPPGTYPITLTATGTPQGSSSPTTHTLSVNIVITP